MDVENKMHIHGCSFLFLQVPLVHSKPNISQMSLKISIGIININNNNINKYKYNILYIKVLV